MKLHDEHWAIIEHTLENGLYCGSSTEMDELCAAGLMEYAGRKPFVPEPYYRVTAKGKETVYSQTNGYE